MVHWGIIIGVNLYVFHVSFSWFVRQFRCYRHEISVYPYDFNVRDADYTILEDVKVVFAIIYPQRITKQKNTRKELFFRE